jgi:uncharacterized protein YydD (DUF2326 family)
VIYEIASDLGGFKSLTFRPGLNVLLATKSAGATALQTRNGAGKTSLVEVIHFLVGSRCTPTSMFRRNETLANATFTMRFDLDGVPTTVSRTGNDSSKIVVDTATPLPTTTATPVTRRLSNEKWRELLGQRMFRLSARDAEAWQPTFRSMFAYFVRREHNAAFAGSPFQQGSKQAVWDQQVSVSYLLGLDWAIAQEWQSVREKEKQLAELKKAMAEGTLGPQMESAAALRAKLAVLDEKNRRGRSALSSFRVLEQYHDLEDEASKLTLTLNHLADDTALDQRYLEELEAATAAEAPPAASLLEELWKEAGVVLPGNVKKRYEDLQHFHDSVVRNRRAYLAAEIETTRARIRDRESQRRQFDERRATIMGTLRCHGALEQYTALQLELARLESETQSLRQKYSDADALEQGKVRLSSQRSRLLERLQQDHHEQRETLDRAAVIFAETSGRLYQQAGQLIVDATDSGPKFDIKIHAEDSRGIGNMQIFCFDMTLMRLCAERGIGPGFLVHDSHLFDGVDERQAGKALELGARVARDVGFQYIVTMNSDALPTELPLGFDLKPHIHPISLTDATETGGLFGFRFE